MDRWTLTATAHRSVSTPTASGSGGRLPSSEQRISFCLCFEHASVTERCARGGVHIGYAKLGSLTIIKTFLVHTF